MPAESHIASTAAATAERRTRRAALHLESIKARSGLEDCLSSLKNIAKVQNSNSHPTRSAERAYRACPKILGSWRALSKSSRSDLVRRPKQGTDVSTIRWNLSTNCSTVMPNVG
jgi:hypothetical protein